MKFSDVIVNWSKQLANGMAYIHSKKVIHRDLKSGNSELLRFSYTRSLSSFLSAVVAVSWLQSGTTIRVKVIYVRCKLLSSVLKLFAKSTRDSIFESLIAPCL